MLLDMRGLTTLVAALHQAGATPTPPPDAGPTRRWQDDDLRRWL